MAARSPIATQPPSHMSAENDAVTAIATAIATAAQPLALPSDGTVIDLLRGGCSPQQIYAALYPQGRSDLTPQAFADIARALDVAARCEVPAEQLPAILEAAEQDLLVARAAIVQAIDEGANEDGKFNAKPHEALCKNTDALLKCHAARQDRQVHQYNLRVARERARLQLLGETEEGVRQ